jgi:uncharacterized membrane protein YgcG
MQTVWIVSAVAALVVIFVILIFNRLIRGRNLVREGWSGIDVQLRRRSDLIPNLVEIVKGYVSHEYTSFEDIAAKRTPAIAAGGVAAAAGATVGSWYDGDRRYRDDPVALADHLGDDLSNTIAAASSSPASSGGSGGSSGSSGGGSSGGGGGGGGW